MLGMRPGKLHFSFTGWFLLPSAQQTPSRGRPQGRNAPPHTLPVPVSIAPAAALHLAVAVGSTSSFCAPPRAGWTVSCPWRGSVPAPSGSPWSSQLCSPPSTTCWNGRGEDYQADLVPVTGWFYEGWKSRYWNQRPQEALSKKRKVQVPSLSSALQSPSSTHSWQSLTQSQLAKEKLGLESLSLSSTDIKGWIWS